MIQDPIKTQIIYDFTRMTANDLGNLQPGTKVIFPNDVIVNVTVLLSMHVECAVSVTVVGRA